MNSLLSRDISSAISPTAQEKLKQKVCHQERKFCGSKHPPILFIGDHGFGIGFRVKRYARFGGSWMAAEHNHCTQVCITTEYNSSQTCLYCFCKWSHTLKQKDGRLVENRGWFICYNLDCLAYLKVMAKDRVSSMAGLAQILFGVTIPGFDPQPSTAKSKRFNEKAVAFCKDFLA